jgi:hypothetical protein
MLRCANSCDMTYSSAGYKGGTHCLNGYFCEGSQVLMTIKWGSFNAVFRWVHTYKFNTHGELKHFVVFNQLYAEEFLKRWHPQSWSRNPPSFMEPKLSLRCSKESAIRSCSMLIKLRLHTHNAALPKKEVCEMITFEVSGKKLDCFGLFSCSSSQLPSSLYNSQTEKFAHLIRSRKTKISTLLTISDTGYQTFPLHYLITTLTASPPNNIRNYWLAIILK